MIEFNLFFEPGSVYFPLGAKAGRLVESSRVDRGSPSAGAILLVSEAR